MTPRPTESELAILQQLWSRGRATVREVNDSLNEVDGNQIGYTTTLKLLQIMTDKGLVTRDTSRRTHVYQAAVSEQHTRSGLVHRLVDGVFGGSASQLVLHALGDHRASAEELTAIKNLIHRLEQEEE